MRYVFSCRRCEFIAYASDLRSLGSQLNTHALSCAHDPMLMMENEEGDVTIDPSGGSECEKVA